MFQITQKQLLEINYGIAVATHPVTSAVRLTAGVAGGAVARPAGWHGQFISMGTDGRHLFYPLALVRKSVLT